MSLVFVEAVSNNQLKIGRIKQRLLKEKDFTMFEYWLRLKNLEQADVK